MYPWMLPDLEKSEKLRISPEQCSEDETGVCPWNSQWPPKVSENLPFWGRWWIQKTVLKADGAFFLEKSG